MNILGKFSRLTCVLFATLAVVSAARAEDEPGFHDDSELGVVLTGGNTQANTINLKQLNTNAWGKNVLRFQADYLHTETNSVDSARSWDLGLRYERILLDDLGVFAGLNEESDVFAGYVQRYNADVGVKYTLLKSDTVLWNAEAGYRHTIENDVTGLQSTKNFARLYSEVNAKLDNTLSGKYWLELLPDFTDSSDYRINTEVSLSVLLSRIFSLKLSYLVKYIHVPLAPGKLPTDEVYTTALVAKF